MGHNSHFCEAGNEEKPATSPESLATSAQKAPGRVDIAQFSDVAYKWSGESHHWLAALHTTCRVLS
jgi:hypothetical protein